MKENAFQQNANIFNPLYFINRRQQDLPHRKRTEEEAVNRRWSDEEILEMIDKIHKGFTYQDVTDGKHVPISTLWTRFLLNTLV